MWWRISDLSSERSKQIFQTKNILGHFILYQNYSMHQQIQIFMLKYCLGSVIWFPNFAYRLGSVPWTYLPPFPPQWSLPLDHLTEGSLYINIFINMKHMSLAIQLKCPRLLLEKWQNIKNQQVRDTCWFLTYSAQRDESCYGNNNISGWSSILNTAHKL